MAYKLFNLKLKYYWILFLPQRGCCIILSFLCYLLGLASLRFSLDTKQLFLSKSVIGHRLTCQASIAVFINTVWADYGLGDNSGDHFLNHMRDSFSHSKENWETYYPMLQRPNCILDVLKIMLDKKEISAATYNALRYKTHPIYAKLVETAKTVGVAPIDISMLD